MVDNNTCIYEISLDNSTGLDFELSLRGYRHCILKIRKKSQENLKIICKGGLIIGKAFQKE